MTTQKEKLYRCTACGRSNFLKQARHKSQPGSANPWCDGPFEEAGHLSGGGSGPMLPAPVATAPVPTILTGDDQAVAAKFKELFGHAEEAKFRVAAFGIYAQYVKLKLLKHGQFSDWVGATIGAEHYRTVRDHMQFATSTLERVGYKSLKAFFLKWQALPICHSGEFLLLPDAEVPAEAKPIREKVFNLFAGKTKYQLCREWKQVEEDKSGNKKVKRGRLKGHGGASKLQRDRKQQIDEQARLEAMEICRAEVTEWLNEVSDDKHLGLLAPDQAFVDALDLAAGYLRRAARNPQSAILNPQ